MKLLLPLLLLSATCISSSPAYAFHCKTCQCKQGNQRYCLGGVNPVAPSCETICQGKGGVAEGEDPGQMLSEPGSHEDENN